MSTNSTDMLADAMLARGLGPAESIRWPLARSNKLFQLRYGKALVEAARRPGRIPVFGTNGQCGSHDTPLFKGPGVVVGRKGQGPLGVEWVDRDFWVIDTAYALAPIADDVDLQFAYYLIKYVGLNHLKDGTSNPSLTRDTFGAQLFPLPPLKDQCSIAATLGSLDDKIESNRQAIRIANELLDSMGQEAAASLPVVPLSLLASDTRIAINPATLGDALVDHFSLPAFDERVWPEQVQASSIMSNKLVVDGPSILISRLNPRFNRTWWVVPTDHVMALASTEFSRLTASSSENLAGVWLAVRDEYFREELTRRVTGTSGSHQRVRSDDMLAIEVPDMRLISDQSKRDALTLLDLVHVRRREIIELSALREGLLPELLSGRIRVPEAESACESVT